MKYIYQSLSGCLLLISCLSLTAHSQKVNIDPSWLKEVEIGGVLVQQLRVPDDKIPVAGYAIDVKDLQRDLDHAYQNARGWKLAEINWTGDFITMIKNKEGGADWPVEYYQKELEAYQAYNKMVGPHERRIFDSTVKVRGESTRFSQQVKGYCFISKPVVLVKQKMSASSRTIGKIYLGSYIKVEAFDDASGYAMVTLDGMTGLIRTDDYVDDLQKLKATEEEMNIFKSRRYYKFEADPAYEAYLDKEARAEARRQGIDVDGASASSGNSKPGKSRTYHLGPKGGCYYINSNGNKTYVDRGYCQ